MPPARTSSSTQAKRPRPPFNPPRPRTVARSDKPKPQTPAASKLAKRQASKASNAAPASDKTQGSSKAATKALNHKRPTITLSSDEDSENGVSDLDSAADDNDDDNEDDEDDEVEDTAARSRQRRTPEANTSHQEQSVTDSSRPPPIPQKLLTRLLYESFEDKDMKIGREALAVFGKYMETFVREALARAVYERQDTDGAMGGDGFLQMEDLEKLAPQLLLDF